MKGPTRRRRAAYVLADPGVPAFGKKGSTLHVHEVIRSLAVHGFDVDLYAVRFDQAPPKDLPLSAFHRLSPCPRGDPATRERQCMRLNDEVRSALASRGPYDLVYERYSLWNSAGMEHARMQGVPGVLEVNAPLIVEQAAYRELVHRDEAENLARIVFEAASLVVAVSTTVEQHVRDLAPQVATLVLPNGVNPDRFSVHRSPAGSGRDGAFVIGFLGHLKPWQGVAELADLFGRVASREPRARLLVVGDGPERQRLLDRLDRAGLSDLVTLTGALEHHEVPTQLVRMDVGVAPYPAADGFYFSPLKVVEYMAAALPVVASDIGPIAAVLRDGVTGYLCEPGDSEEFADRILELAADRAAGREMGRRAREYVLTHHTWDAGVRRLLERVDLLPAGTPTKAGVS